MEKADILDLTVAYLFKVKSRMMGGSTVTSQMTPIVSAYPYYSPVTSQREPPEHVTTALSSVPYDENNNAAGHVNLNYMPMTSSDEDRDIDVESIEQDSSNQDYSMDHLDSSMDEHNASWDSISTEDSEDSAFCEQEHKMWRPWWSLTGDEQCAMTNTNKPNLLLCYFYYRHFACCTV